MTAIWQFKESKEEYDLFYERAKQYPLLTKEEEVALAKRVEQGDEEAKEIFVTSNLRLVIKNAWGYRNMAKSLTLLDIINEGTIGLIRAVELFDYRKGFKFSTYATWWIRQTILRSIANKGRTIRLPVHVLESLQKVRKVRRALRREHPEAEPSLTEIAEQVNMPVGKIQFLLDVASEPVSIDAQISGMLSTVPVTSRSAYSRRSAGAISSVCPTRAQPVRSIARRTSASDRRVRNPGMASSLSSVPPV